jgi:hypothetical protein
MTGGAPGPDEAARDLALRLATLEEGPIRVRAAARLLAAAEPSRAAEMIAALARSSGGEERAAMAAVGRALADPGPELPYPFLAELYAEAVARDLPVVTSLLVAPPPRRAYVAPRDKPDARLARLTLGHKKAMARAQRDPDLLARLAAEGDPVVVRELLRNPQLTEAFAVRIASRRPIHPGTLRCLFDSRRWRNQPAVALAIARNPYVETELALKLLPFLGAAELRELASDGALHPLTRTLAGRIARERG